MLILVALAAMLALAYLVMDGRPKRSAAPQASAAPLAVQGPAKKVYTDADYAAYDILPGIASFKDFLQGCVIYGETGSGKSSGPYRTAIIRALSHPSRPSCLVLAAKSGVYQDWVKFCRLSKRSDDLIRFGPGHTCDLLKEALDHPHATVRDACSFLDHLINLDRVDDGGGDNKFFYDGAGRMVRNAVTLVWKSTGTASVSDVHEIVTKAPITAKAVAEVKALSESDLPDDELRQRSLIAYCIREAKRKGIEGDDLTLAKNYWRLEHHQQSERQRAAIMAIVINLTDQLLGSGMGDIFSAGTTSCGPRNIIHDGAIVVLDMPLNTWGEAGRRAQLAMKLLTQKFCLMRSGYDDPRIVIIAQDEFQQWALGGHDSFVQSISRESRLCSIACTQTVSLLRAKMGGERARDEVASLNANHSVKVFASQSDPETNFLASSLAGNRWVDVEGGSMPTDRPPYNLQRDMAGLPMPGGPSINWSATYRPCVDPEVFHQLERGGNGWVQCMVFQNGRTYPDTWRPYICAWFDQNYGEEGP